ncbi:MAG: hypothetical protein RR863_02010 [Erysipelotrichaceae bacterium]
MKLKRIVFALFIAIFVLNGCVDTNYLREEAIIAPKLKTADIGFKKERITKDLLNEKANNDIPPMEYREYDGRDGLDWIASLSDQGSSGKLVEDYDVMRDSFGNVISMTLVTDSKRVEDRRPPIMQFGGRVEVGSEFFPRTTTYGLDCYGCYGAQSGSGGSAAGVKFNIDRGVQQSNGEWLAGITYDGYYIVAADRNIPIGSVLEISDHGYSGAGLSPGVPFLAKVLDRGGGISSDHLDLYSGSEKKPILSINRQIHQPKVTIVSIGNGNK